MTSELVVLPSLRPSRTYPPTNPYSTTSRTDLSLVHRCEPHPCCHSTRPLFTGCQSDRMDQLVRLNALMLFSALTLPSRLPRDIPFCNTLPVFLINSLAVTTGLGLPTLQSSSFPPF